MKKIHKIDCGLYPLGLFTILSGIGLHIAGHGSNHNTWEIWAVIHSVLSVSFTILLAYHIHTHWAWFKHVRRSTINRKRFMTTMLTMFSISTVFSGIALLAIWGVNTQVGLLHYKIGILKSATIIQYTIKGRFMSR